VLSDISALQFDYQYEYRKTDGNSESKFTEDFFLKVYIGSEFIESINEVPFYRIDEVYQSEGYNYQTGWVKFSEIRQFDLNQIPELSLIMLPEPFVSVLDASKLKAERKQFQVEY
jgi:homoserine dehydrogenase